MSLSKAFTWGSGARTFLPKNCLDNVLTRRKIYALHVPSPSESEKRWSFFFFSFTEGHFEFCICFCLLLFHTYKESLEPVCQLEKICFILFFKSSVFSFTRAPFYLSLSLPFTPFAPPRTRTFSPSHFLCVFLSSCFHLG